LTIFTSFSVVSEKLIYYSRIFPKSQRFSYDFLSEMLSNNLSDLTREDLQGRILNY